MTETLFDYRRRGGLPLPRTIQSCNRAASDSAFAQATGTRGEGFMENTTNADIVANKISAGPADTDATWAMRMAACLSEAWETACHAPKQAWRAMSRSRVTFADVELASGFVVSCLQKHEVRLVDSEVQSYFSQGLIESRPGDVVFDVGANIGLFTLAAFLRSQRDVTVYAFEPVDVIYERLCVNVQRCAAGTRLQAFDFGLSNCRKQVPLAYYPMAPVLSTCFPDEAADLAVMKTALLNNIVHLAEAPAAVRLLRRLPPRLRDAIVRRALARTLRPTTIICQLETLSRFVHEHGVERIDLLKIDAEKAEHEILLGIEPADWQRIRQVVVEVHDLDDRLAMITAQLHAQGLTRIVVDQPPTLRHTNIHNVFAARA